MHGKLAKHKTIQLTVVGTGNHATVHFVQLLQVRSRDASGYIPNYYANCKLTAFLRHLRQRARVNKFVRKMPKQFLSALGDIAGPSEDWNELMPNATNNRKMRPTKNQWPDGSWHSVPLFRSHSLAPR
jgi:hypothetical protein